MRIPLIVENINNSSDCQFYVTDQNGLTKCFVKDNISCEETLNQVERKSFDLNLNLWDKDCKGEVEKCFFATAFFESSIKKEKQSLDFDKYTEVVKKPLEIKIKLLEKPIDICKIKTDCLVLPTNKFLISTNKYINAVSKNNLQKKNNDTYNSNKNIKVLDFYEHSNIENLLCTNLIMGVIAGETWAIAPSNISEITSKILMYADTVGYKNIVFVPFDCGVLNIDVAAREQIKAIYNFLKNNKNLNIKNIYIFMEDKFSYEYYIKEYTSIFKVL